MSDEVTSSASHASLVSKKSTAADDYDETALQVVSAGIGGIPEMRNLLRDDQVMWAMLRIESKQAAAAGTKVILLDFVGEKAPKPLRDKAQGLSEVVSHLLRGRGKDHFNATATLRGLEEVTTEVIVSECASAFITSPAAGFAASIVQDYLEQLEDEKAAAVRRHEAEEEKLAQMRAARKANLQGMAARILGEVEAQTQASGAPRSILERGIGPPGAASAKKPSLQPRSQAQRATLQPAGGKPGRSSRKGSSKRPSALVRLSVEGLTQVGKGGLWNWILIGPDAQKLPFLGGGTGGVDEMRATAEANEDLVMYGLLRVAFDAPGFRQTRFCMIHIIGDSLPTVKRGRWNSLRPQFEKRFGEFASITAVCADVATADVTQETVLAKLGFAGDYLVQGLGSEVGAAAAKVRASAAVYEETLAKEQQDAEEQQTPMAAVASHLVQEDSAELAKSEEAERQASEPAAAEEDEEDWDDDDDWDSEEEDYEDLASFRDGEAPYADERLGEVSRLVRHARLLNWALVRPRP